MENTIAATLLASFGATFLAMPVARRLGAAAGLLDHPHVRKLQRTAVPRTGGIAILVGLLAGIGVLLSSAGTIGFPLGRELLAVFLGGVIIHLTGVLDDLLDLSAWGKLLAQTLAVGIVIGSGVVIDRVAVPGLGSWALGWLATPITAFFLLGFVNAVNLVDGLDGLAGGIVGIGALMLSLLGILEGNLLLAALSAVLLGAILGFLPFNFSKKRKTFLGDAGSMLLGYMLPVTAILGARFTGDSTALFVVLAAASMPVFDTATTILRRFRNRVGIFAPDSMHVHHRFIRFGLSPQRTVLTILALTLLASGMCLAAFVVGTRLLLAASALAGALVVVEIRGQRKRNLEEEETTFREILFYLLGAEDGRGPRLGGELAMADVIADVHGRTGTDVPGSVPSPNGSRHSAAAKTAAPSGPDLEPAVSLSEAVEASAGR
jgi:UDP-GlcNAc:undecaprenyl-phosphate GlcNAc-1-phosphate transferase